ncbi:MAG: manganese efflux pump [Spirochaetaceae bacterium]|nr:manganese efflux pump [Spirochaetaceae bacterium]
MGLGELVLLAMGLAMDAFAVSVTNGMCLKKCGLKEVLAMALTFGSFQAAMPVLGYWGGSLFYEQIKFVDHWIAF